MDKPLEIQGSLLARNTLLNLIGRGLPLVVAVFSMPFIIHGLGTDRFGLLSLAWVVLGYFTIFDLGLGLATTKFVAEALGKGDKEQIPRLVWTAVTVQAFFGLLGAIVLAGITPLLVERILNIPPELIKEAKDTFYLLALSIPMVLVSGSFRGVLEAAQRFDLVNIVRAPSSALTYLLPLIGLFLGFNLPGIVSLILVVRLAELALFTLMSIRIAPRLKKYSGSFALFPRLFSFGGWVTVSGIVVPILVYLDRFLIASLLSISAVAYYSAPYEAVTRLWIIPASVTMALFPAFSALEGVKDRERLGFLFARAVKYILLALGPLILIVGLFAYDILQVWLGVDFAEKSTIVLQLLGLGVLLNSLAWVPVTFLQGVGRPDLPAKFHLLQFPLYLGIVWLFISQWGIAGAAGAWTFRVALETILLFGAVFKVHQLSPRLLVANGTLLTGVILAILAGTACGLKILVGDISLGMRVLLVSGLFCFFAWFSWMNILDDSDREMVSKVVKLWQCPRERGCLK
jgi:O-antigen/teichoic acid export membrane protein